MLGFLKRRDAPDPIEALHARVVAASRADTLYGETDFPDTVEGRFEALTLVALVVLRRLRRLPSPAADVAQDLVDALFAHLEIALRELGVGDMGIPKRMKALGRAFYDRAGSYDPLLEAGDAAGLAAALAERLGVAPPRGASACLLALERRLATADLAQLLASEPTLPIPGGAGMSIPLSRVWSARHVGQAGAEIVVTAEPAEREALARDLGLEAIGSLIGRFRMEGRPDQVHLTGTVEADLTQVCVVTLEPFASRFVERVDLSFRERSERERQAEAEAGQSGEIETDLDVPDELVDGTIDLGAIIAEFLALGLDPYPKKPGATLDDSVVRSPESSPFAALAGLAKRD